MADLDVPLGMLYMLEPVSLCLRASVHGLSRYRSLMVLNFGPIVTMNRVMDSQKYATINYGERPLTSRIKCLGSCIVSEVFWRSKTVPTTGSGLLSLYYYLMGSDFVLDNNPR